MLIYLKERFTSKFCVCVLRKIAATEMACPSQKDNCNPSRFNRQMERTVKELRIFYESILKSLCIPPVFEYLKFRRSLGDIRSCQHPDVTLHAEVDYRRDSFRHAYIFAYSIIHSVTIYDRFSDMMMFNPTMMKRIASMKDIRLCVFGGGPAFEVVAICKLLSKVLSQLGSDGREPFQLHVTCIDICSEWEREVICIINSLQRELKTSDNVTINFSFINADLTKDFSTSVEKAFKKAHFITMNKFLTDVHKVDGRHMFNMINNLIESMSYKSCLFLLDFSGGCVFKKADNKIDNISCIRRIYGPTLHHCCVLKEDTVKQFSTNLQNILPRLKCTVRSTISCSAWVKIRNLGNTPNPPATHNGKIHRRLLRNVEKFKSKEREPKV